MVDKKACKIKKRKYKVTGAIFVTRVSILLLIVLATITVYNKIEKNRLGEVVESSAYIDVNGKSSMVIGVENGAVYTNTVTPKITDQVKKVTLTKDGEKVKFQSGKKISDMGSYILTLEDKNGNVDTVYFDIEN